MDDRVSTSDVSFNQSLPRHPKKGYPIEDDLFLRAVRAGKYRLVLQILEVEPVQSLDINQVDSCGQTALLIATQLSNYEIRNNFVKLLLKHTADVNKADHKGVTPLIQACKSEEKVDTVRNIIKQKDCNINQEDKEGNTAVHWAARYDNWGALRILINSSYTKNRINLASKDSKGQTPLETAIDKDFTETCWVLINEGRMNASTLSPKYQDRLAIISTKFPEIYDVLPVEDNNNNPQSTSPGTTGSPKRRIFLPPSPRVELDPLNKSEQSSTGVQRLTPLEADLSYPLDKYSKLPAISSVDNS